MKYVVYRTSLVFSLEDEEKPCDRAMKEFVDVFYEDGSEKKEEAWVVDVEDLVVFANELGEKIIVHPDTKREVCSYSYPEIEIYDTYRE